MAQTNDDQLKAKVDAYVDEVWEDVVEDIRTLVRIESVEDLSAAEPGKPYGPKANEALVAAEGIASRLGLAVTDLDGCIGYGEVAGRESGDEAEEGEQREVKTAIVDQQRPLLAHLVRERRETHPASSPAAPPRTAPSRRSLHASLRRTAAGARRR